MGRLLPFRWQPFIEAIVAIANAFAGYMVAAISMAAFH